MKLSDLKNLTDKAYDLTKEIKELENFSVVSNMPYVEDSIKTLKAELGKTERMILHYSKAFYVSVATLMQKLNAIPGYGIDYSLTDQIVSDHYYNDSYMSYFSFYLLKNNKEVGKLFEKNYDTMYDDNLDYYITTGIDDRNDISIEHLIKSPLMLKRFKNPKIIEFLNRNDVQNALWQIISESVKHKTQEKIKSTDTSLLIAKHKEAEAKKEVERLQQEKAEQQRNLNEEDFNL